MPVRSILVVTSAAVLLAGCSEPTPEPEPPTSASGTGGSSSASSSSSSEPAATTPLRSESPGKSSHVQVDLCTSSSTQGRVGGTVEHPGRRTESYRIQVFFTDEDGKVIGNTQAEVEARPQEATRWSARATLAYPAHPRCVLGEVR